MNKREIAGIKVVVSGEIYEEYKGTLQEQINNLQSKIDKAIEYINKHIRIDDEYPDYMEMLIEERDELLDILRKED